MKEILIRIDIKNPASYSIDHKNIEILKTNLSKLSNIIPEYKLTKTYKNLSLSAIVKFPFDAVINNIKSSGKNFNITIPVIIINDELNNYAYQNHAYGFLEIFFYDLFIILNIASPGSFELMGWKYEDISENVIPELHCLYFSEGYRYSINELKILQNIPIEKIANLIIKLYDNHDLLPKCAIQKSINALIHLSNDAYTKFSPSTGLLVTYALESILGGGVPRSLLTKRIRLLINSNENKTNRTLLDIYNWRNKIVHGEYSLPHPTIHDVSDGYNLIFIEYIDRLIKGFALLIPLTQILALNDSTDLHFNETVKFYISIT